MIPRLHHLYLARFVLQTQTPLSIGTGQGEGRLDALLVRDANQLPAIPGTSLAGVLRHLHLAIHKDEHENRTLFGGTESEDTASRVHFSWGCLHDAGDRPVQGLRCDDLEALEDPVLQDALRSAPLLRDRVRIDAYGAAEDGGQFNRTVLRAGHRFSLEMAYWSDRKKDPRWEQLLELLVHPEFRLGGATRSGLGVLELVRLHARYFDMRKAEDFVDFGALSQGLDDIQGMQSDPPRRNGTTESLICLELEAEEPFRFGQGDTSLTGENLQLLPQTEAVVRWSDGRGSLGGKDMVLIPGSAVKGALRHRTLFHLNRLHGCFADPDPPAGEETGTPDSGGKDALQSLFGFANDNQEEGGRAGVLLFQDLYLARDQVEPGPMMHNGIDRFTGGVRHHVLFGEELLFQAPPIRLEIHISRAAAVPGNSDELLIWRAFYAALEDLAEGRLALGGGTNRGHGYFHGNIHWPASIEIQGDDHAAS